MIAIIDRYVITRFLWNFLALFGALWFRYVPSLRARRAPVVEAGVADEYNPPPR